MTLTIAITVIAVIILILQLVLAVLVKNVHNTNVWSFIAPAVLGCLTMFVYMLYETVTLSVDTFFTVSVFAWLALALAELLNMYYAFICANRSKNSSTLHRRGRVLTYAVAAASIVLALVTAVMTYFEKVYVYEDAIPLLIITSVAVAATCALCIVVSRKIFAETRLEQKKGLQL